MTEPRFKRGSRFHGRIEHEHAQPCAAEGCGAAGEFRAPGGERGSDGQRDWRWLCLDHVREFNAKYNYFSGMSPEEIAAAQSPHPSWDRKTRAFASNAYARGDIEDPLDILGGRYGRGSFARAAAKNGRVLTGKDRSALSVCGSTTRRASPISDGATPSWFAATTPTQTAATGRTSGSCRT